MLEAPVRLFLDNALPGREAPAGGERRLGGLATAGPCAAMAGRPGLENGCVLGGHWYGARSERLREEFEEGAWPRPWAIEDGGRAQAPCKYTAKKAGLAGMRREEAAKHLHVLASDVAEHVDSVGGRGEYGFDLAVLAAAGGEKPVVRDKERRGRSGASLRMGGQAGPPAADGGGVP